MNPNKILIEKKTTTLSFTGYQPNRYNKLLDKQIAAIYAA
jgi:hypothetical protein